MLPIRFSSLVLGVLVGFGVGIAQAAPSPASEPEPEQIVRRTATWFHDTDRQGLLYACDTFRKGQAPTEKQLANAEMCVVLACDVVAIVSTTGHNEGVRWRQVQKNGEEEIHPQVGAKFSPEMSSLFRQETRYVTINEYRETLGLKARDALPTYFRFSLDVPYSDVIVYHFDATRAMIDVWQKGCVEK